MKSKLTTMTIILALTASTIFAQNIPQKISFQGRLIDANTQKPVTAEKKFTFKIGDWIEEHKNVLVSNGLYSVILGSANPIPLTLFNDWQANMKILVDGKEMAPDIGMVSVPYAFKAGQLDGIYAKNGNVKIYGNESPRVLEITGKRSADSNGTFPGIIALSWHNNDNVVSDIHFGKLGRVAFGGNHTDNSYSNILYAASIEGIAEGPFSNIETMPTGIAFFTGMEGKKPDVLNKNIGIERMRISSTGNIGIGTKIPQTKLDVHGAAHVTLDYGYVDILKRFDSMLDITQSIKKNNINKRAISIHHNSSKSIIDAYNFEDQKWKLKFSVQPNGNVYIGGDVNTNGNIKCNEINQISDYRFKKNISSIKKPIQKVIQLRGINYEWKTEEYPEKNFSNGKQIGMIAQDVEKVIPEIVHTDNEGMKSISYDKITAVLVEAIKELNQKNEKAIQKLKAENAQLKQIICEDRPNHEFCQN